MLPPSSWKSNPSQVIRKEAMSGKERRAYKAGLRYKHAKQFTQFK
jgi:hypothetical protein